MVHPCPRTPGRSVVKQCCTRGFRDTPQVRALSVHAFMHPTAILPPITANSLKPLHPLPRALWQIDSFITQTIGFCER
jgi:hypothetical protein